MDVEATDHLHIAGNPSEEEVVAITAAYTSLLQMLVERSGEKAVEFAGIWAKSADCRLGKDSKNSHLSGKMASWQVNCRLRSRI